MVSYILDHGDNIVDHGGPQTPTQCKSESGTNQRTNGLTGIGARDAYGISYASKKETDEKCA